jgi:Protein of unknown function (DUF1674)
MYPIRALLSPVRDSTSRLGQLRFLSKMERQTLTPALPAEDQRAFEQLLRSANSEAATGTSQGDAPLPPVAEFEGNVNPVTGETGGPKEEPVRRSDGDWSYKGRVSDF